MFRVTFPEDKPFTGTYLSVLFRDGEGQTDSAYLADRFRRKGLTVEDGNDDNYPPMLLSKEELERLPIEQLSDYAQAHHVDIGKATSEKGILEKITEAGKVFMKRGE